MLLHLVLHPPPDACSSNSQLYSKKKDMPGGQSVEIEVEDISNRYPRTGEWYSPRVEEEEEMLDETTEDMLKSLGK